MNREIEFRGKCHDTDDGKPTWEYGFVGYCEGKCTISDHDGCGCFVDEDTVGEFIGLRDMVGKKVFEDDIFLPQYNNFRPMVVKFVNGAYNIARFNLSNTKIIGNIHDNPELLETR